MRLLRCSFYAGLIMALGWSASSIAAQSVKPAQPGHQNHAVAGGGILPAGWSARPDAEGSLKNIKFVVMEPGYHLTLGPATILYRESDRADGPFHTQATFHQMKNLEHAEGYGLFFGGQSLNAPDQKYIYFLVRQDGKFLVKRREGEKTSEITQGWIAHPAIKTANAQGQSTNQLEIDAKKNPSKIDFKVNGKTVYSADSKTLGRKGMVGLRVNHNLDLHVEGFEVHR
jgi:hypothetical protein